MKQNSTDGVKVRHAYLSPEACAEVAEHLVRNAGVEGRCYQTFGDQTPIPSPMDNEGEG